MPRFLRSYALLGQIAVGLWVLCLTGCMATPAQSITPGTPIPSQMAPATQSPTDTLTPSQTASPLPPSHTPSQTVSPAPLRTPTQRAFVKPTKTIPAVILTENPYIATYDVYYSWPSPNGKWLAANLLIEFPPRLHVMRLDGKVKWKVDFLGTRDCDYRPVAWSNDGNFLYIEYRIGHKDGGTGAYYCGPDGVKRLDLRDGSLIPFLEKSDTPQIGCWRYAFTADARKLAYIVSSASEQLVVLDMNTGKKLTYSLDKSYQMAGRIMWGPDQEQLIFAASLPGDSRPEKSTLFWVKIEDDKLAVQEVFTYPSGYIFPVRWKADAVLVLVEDFTQNEDVYREIYLSSQIVLQVTLTPTPGP